MTGWPAPDPSTIVLWREGALWRDAWNGVYHDLSEGLRDAPAGIGREPIGLPGSRILTEDEM